jgi:hypothetical protein
MLLRALPVIGWEYSDSSVTIRRSVHLPITPRILKALAPEVAEKIEKYRTHPLFWGTLSGLGHLRSSGVARNWQLNSDRLSESKSSNRMSLPLTVGEI